MDGLDTGYLAFRNKNLKDTKSKKKKKKSNKSKSHDHSNDDVTFQNPIQPPLPPQNPIPLPAEIPLPFNQLNQGPPLPFGGPVRPPFPGPFPFYAPPLPPSNYFPPGIPPIVQPPLPHVPLPSPITLPAQSSGLILPSVPLPPSEPPPLPKDFNLTKLTSIKIPLINENVPPVKGLIPLPSEIPKEDNKLEEVPLSDNVSTELKIEDQRKDAENILVTSSEMKVKTVVEIKETLNKQLEDILQEEDNIDHEHKIVKKDKAENVKSVLGKDKAKKRLLAFSFAKNLVKPTDKVSTTSSNEKLNLLDFDKMKPASKSKKQSSKVVDPAMKTIAEIEEIKKAEAYQNYLQMEKLAAATVSKKGQAERSPDKFSSGGKKNIESSLRSGNDASSDSEIEEGQVVSSLDGVKICEMTCWEDFNNTNVDIGCPEFRKALNKETVQLKNDSSSSSKKIGNVFDVPPKTNEKNSSGCVFREENVMKTKSLPSLEFSESPLVYLTREQRLARDKLTREECVFKDKKEFYKNFNSLGSDLTRKKVEFINNRIYKRKNGKEVIDNNETDTKTEIPDNKPQDGDEKMDTDQEINTTLPGDEQDPEDKTIIHSIYSRFHLDSRIVIEQEEQECCEYYVTDDDLTWTLEHIEDEGETENNISPEVAVVHNSQQLVSYSEDEDEIKRNKLKQDENEKEQIKIGEKEEMEHDMEQKKWNDTSEINLENEINKSRDAGRKRKSRWEDNTSALYDMDLDAKKDTTLENDRRSEDRSRSQSKTIDNNESKENNIKIEPVKNEVKPSDLYSPTQFSESDEEDDDEILKRNIKLKDDLTKNIENLKKSFEDSNNYHENCTSQSEVKEWSEVESERIIDNKKEKKDKKNKKRKRESSSFSNEEKRKKKDEDESKSKEKRKSNDSKGKDKSRSSKTSKTENKDKKSMIEFDEEDLKVIREDIDCIKAEPDEDKNIEMNDSFEEIKKNKYDKKKKEKKSKSKDNEKEEKKSKTDETIKEEQKLVDTYSIDDFLNFSYKNRQENEKEDVNESKKKAKLKKAKVKRSISSSSTSSDSDSSTSSDSSNSSSSSTSSSSSSSGSSSGSSSSDSSSSSSSSDSSSSSSSSEDEDNDDNNKKKRKKNIKKKVKKSNKKKDNNTKKQYNKLKKLLDTKQKMQKKTEDKKAMSKIKKSKKKYKKFQSDIVSLDEKIVKQLKILEAIENKEKKKDLSKKKKTKNKKKKKEKKSKLNKNSTVDKDDDSLGVPMDVTEDSHFELTKDNIEDKPEEINTFLNQIHKSESFNFLEKLSPLVEKKLVTSYEQIDLKESYDSYKQGTHFDKSRDTALSNDSMPQEDAVSSETSSNHKTSDSLSRLNYSPEDQSSNFSSLILNKSNNSFETLSKQSPQPVSSILYIHEPVLAPLPTPSISIVSDKDRYSPSYNLSSSSDEEELDEIPLPPMSTNEKITSRNDNIVSNKRPTEMSILFSEDTRMSANSDKINPKESTSLENEHDIKTKYDFENVLKQQPILPPLPSATFPSNISLDSIQLPSIDSIQLPTKETIQLPSIPPSPKSANSDKTDIFSPEQHDRISSPKKCVNTSNLLSIKTSSSLLKTQSNLSNSPKLLSDSPNQKSITLSLQQNKFKKKIATNIFDEDSGGEEKHGPTKDEEEERRIRLQKIEHLFYDDEEDKKQTTDRIKRTIYNDRSIFEKISKEAEKIKEQIAKSELSADSKVTETKNKDTKSVLSIQGNKDNKSDLSIERNKDTKSVLSIERNKDTKSVLGIQGNKDTKSDLSIQRNKDTKSDLSIQRNAFENDMKETQNETKDKKEGKHGFKLVLKDFANSKHFGEDIANAYSDELNHEENDERIDSTERINTNDLYDASELYNRNERIDTTHLYNRNERFDSNERVVTRERFDSTERVVIRERFDSREQFDKSEDGNFLPSNNDSGSNFTQNRIEVIGQSYQAYNENYEFNRNRSPNHDIRNRHGSSNRSPKRRPSSPIDRRKSSPRKRRSSSRDRKRRSKRSRSKDRYNKNKRSLSPRKKSSRRSISPGRKRHSRSPRRKYSRSPKRRRPLHRSRSRSKSPLNYRRRNSRSPLSPKRDRRPRTPLSPRREMRPRSPSLSPRRSRSPEYNQDRYSSIPPLSQDQQYNMSSPLVSFKTSLADSTISDSELKKPYHQQHESHAPGDQQLSPHPSSSSPKRMSLDDRIRNELGHMQQDPRAQAPVVPAPYSHYPPGYEQQYQYQQYPPPIATNQYCDWSNNAHPNTSDHYVGTSQVVQMGNMLRVVPTEYTPVPQPVPSVPTHVKNIVQVGNMIQVIPDMSGASLAALPAVQMIQKPTTLSELQNIPTNKKLIDLPLPPGIPASDVDKELSRLEKKEKRKKEKEQKKIHREKKKKLILLKAKKQLFRDSLLRDSPLMSVIEGHMRDLDEREEEEEENSSPVITTPPEFEEFDFEGTRDPSIRGILVAPGLRSFVDTDSSTKAPKGVKFKDGILPGEGTSQSETEDKPLSPTKPKVTKKKKVKKLKKAAKSNKVKIRILRRVPEDEEDDEYDYLPPPPPPPGPAPPIAYVSAPVNPNYYPPSVIPPGYTSYLAMVST